jgi:transposase
MRVAPAIELSAAARAELEKLMRRRTTPQRVAERCRIVLLAAQGLQNKQTAERMQVAPRMVALWRRRFLQLGVEGLLKDAPRSGRKPSISAEKVAEVVTKTTQSKPEAGTHWSRSTMGRAAGISDSSVGRIWRAHGLKPHRVESFKISNDPNFAEKLEDIVGLYLNPPEHALVLSVDEEPDTSFGPHTTWPAPEERPRPDDDARLQTQWHDHTVCCPQHRYRRGLWPLPAAASSSRVAEVSAPDR